MGRDVKAAPKARDGAHGSWVTAVTVTMRTSARALVRATGSFRFVGDCLQHALVCQGRLHAALDTVMKPWDIAALAPCVREAGGVATGLDGRSEGVVFAGSLLTSCDPDLHEEVLATLRS